MSMPPSRRARARAQAERKRSAAWAPWAVGLGLVLAGALAGYLPLSMLVRPAPGKAMTTAGGHEPILLADAAEIVGPEPTATAAPGDQVELTWEVLNAGQTNWPDYAYRFAPAAGVDAPVISLPKEVRHGEPVTVRVRVTAPAAEGTWRPAWDLTGPGGKVAGGHLSAQVIVTADAAP